MAATFGRELVGMAVLDARGDRLGDVAELVIELLSGDVLTLLVDLESDLDPDKLPWPFEGGLLLLPVDEVERVAAQVILKR